MYWERLVISLRALGDPRSSYASSESPYAYWPVEKWGQKVNVHIELQRKGTNAELMDRNFVADPDTWPIMIDAVELRESIRAADELPPR